MANIIKTSSPIDLNTRSRGSLIPNLKKTLNVKRRIEELKLREQNLKFLSVLQNTQSTYKVHDLRAAERKR